MVSFLGEPMHAKFGMGGMGSSNFSAAAVFAAIGVVWWQHHVAHQQSLAAAQLAASGLLTLMDQTIGGLQSVEQGLQDRIAGTNTNGSQPWYMATILGTLPLPSREDLLALNEAFPACSIDLLRASNSTRQIQTALNTIATVAIPGVSDTTLPDLCRPIQALASDAVASFIEARQTLDEFCPK